MYDSSYYSDGANRTALDNNKYVAKYFYRGVIHDNDAYYISGNQYNSADEAYKELIPTAAEIITSHSIYVGKIVIAKNATNGIAYPREWNAALQNANATSHSDLTDVDQAAAGITDGHISSVAQAISGIKTFASFPITPSSAPTSDYQVANKKYTDNSTASFELRAAGFYGTLGSVSGGDDYISQQAHNIIEWYKGMTVLDAESTQDFEIEKLLIGVFALDTGGSGNNINTCSLSVAKRDTETDAKSTVSDSTITLEVGTYMEYTDLTPNLTAGTTFTLYDMIDILIDTYAITGSNGVFITVFAKLKLA